MIRLIAAIDQQRGIAKHGCIPWSIPSDERFFTNETKKYGGVTLTGRVTFDTFSRPLVDRQNFVLSSQQLSVQGAEIIHDIDSFLTNHSEVWIIGGAEVFAQTIQRADELYITTINATFGCDRFFPDYKNQFAMASQSKEQQENGFTFRYEIWHRKQQSHV